jgi:MFS family permease
LARTIIKTGDDYEFGSRRAMRDAPARLGCGPKGMSVRPPAVATDNPLNARPLTGRQLVVLILVISLAALDGFDTLSMAFVAPVLSHQWGLGKGVIGLLLSSGLVGMAIGSLALAPLADKIGRKPLLLASLTLMSAGSAMSSIASGVTVLAASRIATGIGIGTMIVLTTLLSSEFSNARRRPLVIAAVATVGLPLGGVLGGLASSFLLRVSGWPSVFLSGAIVGALMLPILAALLPESPAFLAARRSDGALARLNAVLLRLGHPAVAQQPDEPDHRRSHYRELFAPDVRSTTLRLVVVNVLIATAAYYVANWLPQIVSDAGLPPAAGSFVSATSTLIGLTGGAVMGLLAGRYPSTRLAMLSMAGMAAGIAAIGFVPASLAMFVAAGAGYYFFQSGTTGIFYGIVATSFQPLVRASGIGLVMGIGRITSAIAPAIAGWMFASGATRGEVSFIFALGPMTAAALMLRTRSKPAKS